MNRYYFSSVKIKFEKVAKYSLVDGIMSLIQVVEIQLVS